MNGMAGYREHIPNTKEKNVCPAKQVWSDGHASHSCSFSCFHSSLLPLPHWLPGQTSGPTHLSLNYFILMCLCPSHVNLSNGSQLSLSAESNSGFVSLTPYTPHLWGLVPTIFSFCPLVFLGGAEGRRESLFLSNSKCLSWTYAQVKAINLRSWRSDLLCSSVFCPYRTVLEANQN